MSDDPHGRREEKQRSSLADLDARIRQAQEAQQPRGFRDSTAGGMTGLGLAMRVGIELVAGVGVGVGIGLLLDHWLGTGPWMLILFFFLGAGAGVLNVFRTVRRTSDGDGTAGRELPSDRDRAQ